MSYSLSAQIYNAYSLLAVKHAEATLNVYRDYLTATIILTLDKPVVLACNCTAARPATLDILCTYILLFLMKKRLAICLTANIFFFRFLKHRVNTTCKLFHQLLKITHLTYEVDLLFCLPIMSAKIVYVLFLSADCQPILVNSELQLVDKFLTIHMIYQLHFLGGVNVLADELFASVIK